MTVMAKLFKNGASQAVRLPKDFRFNDDEVCVKRIGSAVLLYPKGSAWDMMGRVLGKVDDDFMLERGQPKPSDPRKCLESRKWRKG